MLCYYIIHGIADGAQEAIANFARPHTLACIAGAIGPPGNLRLWGNASIPCILAGNHSTYRDLTRMSLQLASFLEALLRHKYRAVYVEHDDVEDVLDLSPIDKCYKHTTRRSVSLPTHFSSAVVAQRPFTYQCTENWLKRELECTSHGRASRCASVLLVLRRDQSGDLQAQYLLSNNFTKNHIGLYFVTSHSFVTATAATLFLILH
jgi:hypothetical protein